jgi:hypothetical protein
MESEIVVQRTVLDRSLAHLPEIGQYAKLHHGGDAMASVADLDQMLAMAKRLSAVDKVRLIDRLAPQIEQDLTEMRPTSYKSLYGALADLGPAPSAEEIDAARGEAWAGLPREDV